MRMAAQWAAVRRSAGYPVGVLMVVLLVAVMAGWPIEPRIARAQSCPLVVLGAAGTFQGPQNDPPENASQSVANFGREVATVIDSLAAAGTGHSGVPYIRTIAISYPATGVAWGGAVSAKLTYDVSAYRMSKDMGYSSAYNELGKQAEDCSSSRFVLVGYSQGAHIMGDLAQSVFHGNGPIDRSRIAAVVLIADPAYNGPSPRTTEVIYSDGRLSQDQDHWEIGGSLGQRAWFDSSDPVVSVCVYGDPVCDGKSLVGQDGRFKPLENQALHSIYLGEPFEGMSNVATWAGRQAAALVRGSTGGNSSAPTATTPAPAPAPVTSEPTGSSSERVEIAQYGTSTVEVTVENAAGAGSRAVRCWNATNDSRSWATNFLGETQVIVPRDGTFYVECPTSPQPGTFSLEFFNWRWSPAITWR